MCSISSLTLLLSPELLRHHHYTDVAHTGHILLPLMPESLYIATLIAFFISTLHSLYSVHGDCLIMLFDFTVYVLLGEKLCELFLYYLISRSKERLQCKCTCLCVFVFEVGPVNVGLSVSEVLAVKPQDASQS